MNEGENNYNEQIKLSDMRSYKVVKSNEFVRKTRFQLSAEAQKIILYLISKIKPEDIDLKEHTFEIIEFCKVCGMDKNNGGNHKHIKQTLKELRDKSVWIELEDGSETTFSWISNVTINKNSGLIKIKIDDVLKPHLLQQGVYFTQYQLLYTLAMKSKYSIRLYEIFKSYEFQHQKIFEISELKKILLAEHYERYPDFRRKVIEIAIQEINEFSDITVAYQVFKESRSYKTIEFSIKSKKKLDERLKTWGNIEKVLSPKKLN